MADLRPSPIVVDRIERTVPEVFTEQVEAHPDRIAVDGVRRLTFGQLEGRASALAQRLLDAQLPSDRPVAIAADTGIETAVAMLAVSKAGLVSVGLDPHQRSERLAEIVEDAAPAAVVVEPRLAAVTALASGLPVLDPTGLPDEHPRVQVDVDPGAASRLGYTSGTTGRPKATVHVHRTDLHMCLLQTGLGLSPADRCGMTFSGTLQATVGYPFQALLNGATLCPFEVHHAPAGYLEWLRSERISMIHAVPTVLRRMLGAAGDDRAGAPDLRVVQLAGEPATGEDVRWLREVLGDHVRVVNTIGSGEVSVFAHHVVAPGEIVSAGPLPLGRASLAKAVVLVDDRDRPVPVGEPGRAIVRSRYVSAGYWRRPELTAEVFRPAPDDTGLVDVHLADLLVQDADGVLWHQGRADDVVKVRGSRVDVGGLEAVLRSIEGVADAVAVQPPGSGRLDAFLVPGRTPLPDAADIRRRVAQELPDVAVPGRIHVVDDLPRTSWGKADRRALAELAGAADAAEVTAAAPPDAGAGGPPSELAAGIAQLWARVLGLSRPPSLDADWFELGGSSVQAAGLMLELARIHGVDLPIATLLEAPTVRALADVVAADQADADRWAPLVPMRTTGTRPPLFVIHALFGNVMMFEPLARHLGEDQPVYGLQSEALSGRPPRAVSIEAMGSSYRDAIVRAHPDGPYLLFGQSFGGTVAFEVARQLQGEGRDVALVAMGDTVNPARLTHRGWHGGGNAAARLLGIDRARVEGAGAGRTVRTVVGQVAWRAGELQRRLRAQAAVARGRRVPPALRGSYVRAVNLCAHDAYEPPRSDIDVLMIRSTDPDPDPTRGWGTVARHVDVAYVEDFHGAIVRDPAVSQTAAAIAAAIDAALASRRSGPDGRAT